MAAGLRPDEGFLLMKKVRTGDDSTDREAIVLHALKMVDKIKLSHWQKRGDEEACPWFDADADEDFWHKLNESVKSKVVCLRHVYQQRGLNSLADDLNGLDAEGYTLDAVLRLQRYHAPLARVRAVGKTKGSQWSAAVAREVKCALDGLAAHCAAEYYYDREGNYQSEDTILTGLVRGLRDLTSCLGLNELAEAVATVTVEPYGAPAARDRLQIVVLPACHSAMTAWCRAHRVKITPPVILTEGDLLRTTGLPEAETNPRIEGYPLEVAVVENPDGAVAVETPVPVTEVELLGTPVVQKTATKPRVEQYQLKVGKLTVLAPDWNEIKFEGKTAHLSPEIKQVLKAMHNMGAVTEGTAKTAKDILTAANLRTGRSLSNVFSSGGTKQGLFKKVYDKCINKVSRGREHRYYLD